MSRMRSSALSSVYRWLLSDGGEVRMSHIPEPCEPRVGYITHAWTVFTPGNVRDRAKSQVASGPQAKKPSMTSDCLHSKVPRRKKSRLVVDFPLAESSQQGKIPGRLRTTGKETVHDLRLLAPRAPPAQEMPAHGRFSPVLSHVLDRHSLHTQNSGSSL